MEFRDKNLFNTYLSSLIYLGKGSQGVCYLDKDTNQVIKVFHSYFLNEESLYNEEDILKFSHVINNTILWPIDVIKINNNVIGYTTLYKNMNNLYKVNPLLVNLDLLSSAIYKVCKDIKDISDIGIRLYDVFYNILYKRGKIYIIDTLEYSFYNGNYQVNMKQIDNEIKLFLVDNYFDDFIFNDSQLTKLYLDDYTSSIEFIAYFKEQLSKCLKKDITRLNDASILVRKKDKEIYKRN